LNHEQIFPQLLNGVRRPGPLDAFIRRQRRLL